MEDARRPYREIAAAVDRSPPTVSDRIERLQELGIVERFTVEVDRSMLVEGSTVLVELDVEPGEDGTVAETLAERSTVEHVIRTADASVLCSAHTDEDGIRDLLADSIAAGRVRDYSVRLVAQSS